MFNESGVSSGFLSDTGGLYGYINSGQNEIATRMIAIQDLRRKSKPFFEFELLKSLMVHTEISVNPGTTDAISFADAGISDYKGPYELYVQCRDTGGRKPATYKTPADLKWSEQNIYQVASVERPQYAIHNFEEIWIRPAIILTEKIAAVDFHYYQAPAEVTIGGGGTVTDLTISERAHECLLYYVLAKCFDQDKEGDLAQKYQLAYEKEFSILCQ